MRSSVRSFLSRCIRSVAARRQSASSPTAAAGLAIAALGLLVGCGDPGPNAIAYVDEDGVLTVIAGTFTRKCEDVTAIILQCGRWELAVHMNPAAQSGEQPIASPDTWAENLVSDGRKDGTECTIRAAPFEQGSIEIDEISDDHVRYTITGTASGKFDADGTFEAQRCD